MRIQLLLLLLLRLLGWDAPDAQTARVVTTAMGWPATLGPLAKGGRRRAKKRKAKNADAGDVCLVNLFTRRSAASVSADCRHRAKRVRSAITCFCVFYASVTTLAGWPVSRKEYVKTST